MKKILTSIALCAFVMISTDTIKASGWIQNIRTVPSSPVAGDTIYILIDVSFSSGGCDLVNSSYLWNGNALNIQAYHCLGPLTYICDVTDTFKIYPLDTGTYTVDAAEYEGDFMGGPTCSTFTVADSKSINFQVTSIPTLVNDLNKSGGIKIQLEKEGKLIIEISDQKYLNASFKLYDYSGKEISSSTLSENSNHFSVSGISNGIYFYEVRQPDGNSKSGKILPEN